MLLILTQDGFIPFMLVGLIVIFSICVHELSHGLAALQQGDQTPIRTGHMTLNPLKHMGWEATIFLIIAGITWGSMPVNPSRFRSAKWGEVIVSAAGPLSNLTLGLLSIALIRWLLASSTEGTVGAALIVSKLILLLLALINLKLFVVNMLPIPPLDGHVVFSKFFPELEPLKDSPFGLAALMILFLSPFGEGLDMVVSWFIAHATGIPLNNLISMQ
ncbi:site-2 protease family protein [Trichocoleus desertorum AS-A10]|uniref:site-2 protease family protein n=1 Tax=Trichocoleus desertorum TaxID=1481672 RepID=UPI00329A1D42